MTRRDQKAITGLVNACVSTVKASAVDQKTQIDRFFKKHKAAIPIVYQMCVSGALLQAIDEHRQAELQDDSTKNETFFARDAGLEGCEQGVSARVGAASNGRGDEGVREHVVD